MSGAPLPPLATIRVFEAAARRLSFTQAAEELGMTQAAVSYQIKQLEERIGAPVFRRAGRNVVLTAEGERLSQAASEAMGILRDAFAELHEGGDLLTISVLPTLAATWLVPRLGAFQFAHPDLAVRLETNNRLVDLAHEDADLGIRAGLGQWPGLEARRLFPSLYTPLISPQLLDEVGPLTRPEQLRALPLIGDPKEWQAWFKAAGLDAEDGELSPRTSYETQTYEVTAAIAGQGLALVNPIFFAPEIAAGRLVRPFETVWRHRYDYWLAYPHARRQSRKIRAFCEWLLDAVARDAVIAEEMARL